MECAQKMRKQLLEQAQIRAEPEIRDRGFRHGRTQKRGAGGERPDAQAERYQKIHTCQSTVAPGPVCWRFRSGRHQGRIIDTRFTASAAVIFVTKALPSPRRAAGSDEFIAGRRRGHDLRDAEQISPLPRNERGDIKQTKN